MHRPRFDGEAQVEAEMLRVKAVQHWNHSEFALLLPFTGSLRRALERWHPDVVHSHRPFLLGDTALRVAAAHDIPIVFTHHTMYEHCQFRPLEPVPRGEGRF
jgi:1,2-diacylglycerol 3-alpha-glucosyltransferase